MKIKIGLSKIGHYYLRKLRKSDFFYGEIIIIKLIKTK